MSIFGDRHKTTRYDFCFAVLNCTCRNYKCNEKAFPASFKEFTRKQTTFVKFHVNKIWNISLFLGIFVSLSLAIFPCLGTKFPCHWHQIPFQHFKIDTIFLDSSAASTKRSSTQIEMDSAFKKNLIHETILYSKLKVLSLISPKLGDLGQEKWMEMAFLEVMKCAHS